MDINGRISLPTEKAERGSHYSAFAGSSTAGHRGGEVIVRNTLAKINKMFVDD